MAPAWGVMGDGSQGGTTDAVYEAEARLILLQPLKWPRITPATVWDVECFSLCLD